MTKKNQAMEVQEQEETPADEMERTRSRRSFVPRSDIYENEKEIIVLADIPGANEKTVDITLEKMCFQSPPSLNRPYPVGLKSLTPNTKRAIINVISVCQMRSTGTRSRQKSTRVSYAFGFRNHREHGPRKLP